MIEEAERLKKELTDKWVVVSPRAPELKRFADLTGKVKTVNMNCRALVEFDGPADITWYDIDPSFLTVVDGPKPKAAAAHKDEKPPAKSAPAAAKPATAPAAAGSPLDKIRAGGSKPAAAAAAPAPASGGSPLDRIRASANAPPAATTATPVGGGSPLDKIRASAKGGAPPAAPPVATSTTPTATPAKPRTAPASGGSPLDKIRASQANKSSEPAAVSQEAAPVTPASGVESSPVPGASRPAVPESGSILDRIRAQGPAKRV